MESITTETDEEAHNAKVILQKKQREIETKKPYSKDIGEDVTILQPCNDKHLKTIKYYNPRILTKGVKKNFGKYLEKELITLKRSLPVDERSGAYLGQYWDRFLSDRINEKKPTSGKRDVADSLFDHLEAKFGIKLLVSHMQLYGYMYSQEELSPEVYYWCGDADAVGWYYNTTKKQNEYVIVDWKVVDLLNYWEKNKYAFGKHLHQCLVYARLLQLHLKLEYLPSILIVAISNNNGKDIHPGFFRDYPRECKSLLDEQLVWSIEQPKPLRNIYSKFPFNPTLKEGVVPEKMPLTELFAKGAKVNDLLKAFDLNGLKVIKETM